MAAAVCDAKSNGRLPETDAYDRVLALQEGMGGLLLDAQKADAEDDAAMVTLG